MPENRYIDSLLLDLQREVEQWSIERPISSIFIGGGTPSLFSPAAFSRLFAGIQRSLKLAETAEITLEANPGTFESEKFKEFRATGINRLSIGIQSFDSVLLQQLGRVHNGVEAIKAAEIAHQAGFTNFNLDLMFGLPNSTAAQSALDVSTAISLAPSHISFYQLTLEPNTLFYKFPPPLPDDEHIFQMQQQCQELLQQANYLQYEISAYSRPGKLCQHNLNYWRFGDYLGIGAGAHGKITLQRPNHIIRTLKPKHPEHYLQQMPSSMTTIPLQELPVEFLMNQLRLKQGFSLTHFQQQTGLALSALEPALSQCVQAKLLSISGDNCICTEQGWNFLDAVLEKFIP